jgi:hypothetical protein
MATRSRAVAARSPGRTPFEVPRALFPFPMISGSTYEAQTYDVTADGARLIALSIPEARRPRQLEVVTGWTSTLERLAPRAK